MERAYKLKPVNLQVEFIESDSLRKFDVLTWNLKHHCNVRLTVFIDNNKTRLVAGFIGLGLYSNVNARIINHPIWKTEG